MILYKTFPGMSFAKQTAREEILSPRFVSAESVSISNQSRAIWRWHFSTLRSSTKDHVMWQRRLSATPYVVKNHSESLRVRQPVLERLACSIQITSMSEVRFGKIPSHGCPCRFQVSPRHVHLENPGLLCTAIVFPLRVIAVVHLKRGSSIRSEQTPYPIRAYRVANTRRILPEHSVLDFTNKGRISLGGQP